ncbi:hypothetical protein [Stutzerimonas kunmingensis]|uniref:hypothetical protein n=1 Tax=Stutzerimonas kunmingensis TaxID=1211807 RepID=UPI0028AABDAD|nr:hypothetical protein [Stutzerimonas kunmingensis]
MSLQTRITALVQAIGADIKALYSGKVGTTDPRLTDAREWTASTVTQAEAEAGTATTRRAWTAQRVFQAIAAWWAASAMKTKLDGIANGATANASDAQLRDRATHTGTQAISTVSGLQTALDGKLATSARGVANGVASLDANGLIPPMQLPSYVDDVLEYAATSNFPATGETGKIYIAINGASAADPTKQYRWTGTAYSEITSSPGSTDAVPEGSGNLYFTADRVRSTVLTGLSLASSAAVAATDTVLAAFGKIQARLNLLGTAANANVQTSTTNNTSGALMAVGAFGLGGREVPAFQLKGTSLLNETHPTGFYQQQSSSGVTDTPGSIQPCAILVLRWGSVTNDNVTLQVFGVGPDQGRQWFNTYRAATGLWSGWREVFHTGNFSPDTKQDKSSLIATATSRTLALTDAWNYVRPGTTSAITLTVPTNSSAAFEIGTEITVRALGNVTLAAASGVTLNAPSGGTLNMTARMTVTLKKVATNEWDVIGQTVAA